MLGGRCSGNNGQPCALDNKAQCFHGMCRCIYGTTSIEGKCVTGSLYVIYKYVNY